MSISIRDIAAASGFARTTVSMALRGDPRIAEKTRAEISETATRLGYRANPLVHALMAQLRVRKPVRYQANLAFLVPPGIEKQGRYGIWKFLDGVRTQAGRLGFKVETVTYGEPGLSPEKLTRILINRGIHGLVLPPVRPTDPPFALDWSQFAAVAVGDQLFKPTLHFACSHQAQGMSLALQELTSLGYRRIGLHLRRLFDDYTSHRWTSTFLHWQQSRPACSRVPLLIPDDITPAPFLAWMDRHRPDVVLSHHAEALDWLKKSGRSVPADTGFTHLWASPQLGSVAGIDQRPELVGAAAVDLLIGQLHRNERGLPPWTKSVLVDGVWRPGDTLRSSLITSAARPVT